MSEEARLLTVHGYLEKGWRECQAENVSLRDQLRVAREHFEKIAIDNHITSGSFGPLMDTGFVMGWNLARDIARSALSLLPKEGEK